MSSQRRERSRRCVPRPRNEIAWPQRAGTGRAAGVAPLSACVLGAATNPNKPAGRKIQTNPARQEKQTRSAGGKFQTNPRPAEIPEEADPCSANEPDAFEPLATIAAAGLASTKAALDTHDRIGPELALREFERMILHQHD
jgi:hypothetical protein